MLAVAFAVPAAAAPAYYWNRPHAELRIIQRQIPRLSPIIDARCTGFGSPRFTSRGTRLFRVFDCRVLTNGGGRFPWVAVRITTTGPTTFRASIE